MLHGETMLANENWAALAQSIPFCVADTGDTVQVSRWLADDPGVLRFIERVVVLDPHDASLDVADGVSLACIPHLRALPSSLGLRLGQFVAHLAAIIDLQQRQDAGHWKQFARAVQSSPLAAAKTSDFLQTGNLGADYAKLEQRLVDEHPHAVYPTSPYRRGGGRTWHNDDFTEVEATMTSTIHTSIRVVEGVLDPECDVLADQYRPLGRCVCVVDDRVDHHFGWQLERYFALHRVELEKLVYRAMEADKGIPTVERMLGDFKQLGVSRNEPVLVVGGGVLTDTAGLACSLYHRGTPYIMLSTSVVAGIDAGPSPRTCCDGFGYKNLFGAYHPPVLSITDRAFFKTLHPGWIRHGVAEIIKMAVVKDHQLFVDLETIGDELITSRFGTVRDCTEQTDSLSSQIVARGIKSYVEAEYGNLYETHQCRPHAYGHTWSPGFEIPAGLLHGHAVSIGMGFGAFVSEKLGWIDRDQRDRVTRLIETFGLSLHHDALTDHDLLWASQTKMTEKRGGHLAAPLPSGQIGRCGYLRTMSQKSLSQMLDEYRRFCHDRPGQGIGVDPLCSDVGLEDPSIVGESLAIKA